MHRTGLRVPAPYRPTIKRSVRASRLDKVPILFLTLGAVPLGPSDAVRSVNFLEPKHVVPCHYDTFPPIKQDAAAFASQVEQRTPAKAHVLAPGESFDIP